MRNRVGFMQGRLSPPVDGRIQAFPHDQWHEEFALASEADLALHVSDIPTGSFTYTDPKSYSHDDDGDPSRGSP